MVKYNVKRDYDSGNKLVYNIVEEPSNTIVKSYSEFVRAQSIAHGLNNGRGFNTLMPSFFVSNLDHFKKLVDFRDDIEDTIKVG